MHTRISIIRGFPRAIVHVDGDSFFVSCEQANDPSLRDKAVVTGGERGVATSLSREAKALGIIRGMPIYKVRKKFPSCIVVSSDYETYSLVSKRMYDIVRRYTDTVEEYSIDECFADITGWQRPLKMSYAGIARSIKTDLESELGVTFSLGLAPTKVLAKVASKWKKPAGFTVMPGRAIHEFLRDVPIGTVWGVGPKTAEYLSSRSIKTALQFARADEEWVTRHLSKPHQGIHCELRGTPLYRVDSDTKESYQSISRTRTFWPATNDKELLFSRLSENTEAACAKARRYKLTTKNISAFLKTQDFRYHGFEAKLSNAVNTPGAIVKALRAGFECVYKPGVLYRATGVYLSELQSAGIQPDLFGEHAKVERMREIHTSVDLLAKKYGRRAVFLGTSLLSRDSSRHALEDDLPQTGQRVFSIE